MDISEQSQSSAFPAQPQNLQLQDKNQDKSHHIMGSDVLKTPESRVSKLFRFSVATLPYGFYINLTTILILALLTHRSLKRTHRSCVDPLTRGALIVVSLGMILSAIAAIDKGEAALQLANFLPFFWLFTILPFIVRSPSTQYKLARDSVLASLPINGLAIAEYLAKTERLPSFCYNWDLIQSWRSAPHIGRAMVMFDHPNVFANYAILIFGLSLGLILSQSHSSQSHSSQSHSSQSHSSQSFHLHLLLTGFGVFGGTLRPQKRQEDSVNPKWLWVGAVLSVIGLFCSGSRNGILVACSQLLLLILITKLNRTLLFLGGLSLAVLGISIFKFGLGTRSIGIFHIMDDPRVGIWKIALDLIGERPWLGWGPGSFKLLYPSHLVDPTYPAVFHTHNLWLLLSVEYGIPVMIGLTVTISFLCYRAMRTVIWMSQGSSALQSSAAMLTGYSLALWGSIQFSMIDVTFYDARLNVMVWVLLAILYVQDWPNNSFVNPALP